MITARPITADNWKDALEIHVHPEQERFVPSVTLTLAKAYIQPDGMIYEPFGIYVDGEMVGFYSLMYRLHNKKVCYIGGFVVDAAYQGRGYGTLAMKSFFQSVKVRFPECEGVFLTVHPENYEAARFYEFFGFEKTGLVVDGEDAMGLTLTNIKNMEDEGARD